MNNRERKNLETFFMVVRHPTLNEQKEANVNWKWCDLIGNHLLTTSQGLFSLGKLFFGSCDSVDKRAIMSLTSI